MKHRPNRFACPTAIAHDCQKRRARPWAMGIVLQSATGTNTRGKSVACPVRRPLSSPSDSCGRSGFGVNGTEEVRDLNFYNAALNKVRLIFYICPRIKCR
ncbi:hypothetical protein TNCT_236251 [Trichonephila clavata]|uniref:Uncharacterized protein n=1 Tax=Trichonephila clavata TaxID=2740835 RepID=A0A8X6GIS9_TRICU|nr:hypothetical protein TNCT_236251 [Trichonephila clavata]